MQPQPYDGTPDAPFPPAPPGWSEVAVSDRWARARAHALVDELALYHVVDERGPSGVYRFFAYETPFGRSVSAVYGSLAGTLGAADIDDPATQAAATAMNNALLAHGYKYADMALYKAFQQLAGLAADGFPGTQTMTELKDVLFAMGVEIAPVPVYPWAPGAYDGVNAPTAAQWAAPTAPSGGNVPQTTPEVVPVNDATCGAWAIDTTNPQAVAIATNLAVHDTPAAWVDGGDYQTTIAGVDWFFGMHWEQGMKAVIAYKCTSGPSSQQASTTSSSSSAAPAIILGTLIVGGLVATGFAARKPLRAMYAHPTHR